MNGSRLPTSLKGVVLAGGRALLCRNDRGDWELPGGRPDDVDSSPEATVAREIFEETGLRVDVGERLGAGVVQVPEGQVAVVGYLATVIGAASDLVRSDEHEEVRYFELRSLPAELPAIYRTLIAAAASR